MEKDYVFIDFDGVILNTIDITYKMYEEQKDANTSK